jgi:hypothetical protein
MYFYFSILKMATLLPPIQEDEEGYPFPVPYNLPRRASSNMEDEAPSTSRDMTMGSIAVGLPPPPIRALREARRISAEERASTIIPTAPPASPEQDNSWRARNRRGRTQLGLNELQNLRRTQYIKAFTGQEVTPELPFNYIQLFEGQRLSPEDFNYMEAVQLGLIDPTQGYNWGEFGSRAVIRPSVLQTGRSPWTVGNRSRVVQGPGSTVIPGSENNTNNPTAPSVSSSGPGFFATMRSGIAEGGRATGRRIRSLWNRMFSGGRGSVQGTVVPDTGVAPVGARSRIVSPLATEPGFWSRIGGAIARGATATGRGIKRGAVTAGGAIARGAVTAGGAIARGATATGRGIARGATATGRGIARGATATGRGIARGATATGRGIARGATATGRGIARGATVTGRGAVSAFVTVGKGTKRLASQAAIAYQERKDRKAMEATISQAASRARIPSRERNNIGDLYKRLEYGGSPNPEVRGSRQQQDIASVSNPYQYNPFGAKEPFSEETATQTADLYKQRAYQMIAESDLAGAITDAVKDDIANMIAKNTYHGFVAGVKPEDISKHVTELYDERMDIIRQYIRDQTLRDLGPEGSKRDEGGFEAEYERRKASAERKVASAERNGKPGAAMRARMTAGYYDEQLRQLRSHVPEIRISLPDVQPIPHKRFNLASYRAAIAEGGAPHAPGYGPGGKKPSRLGPTVQTGAARVLSGGGGGKIGSRQSASPDTSTKEVSFNSLRTLLNEVRSNLHNFNLNAITLKTYYESTGLKVPKSYTETVAAVTPISGFLGDLRLTNIDMKNYGKIGSLLRNYKEVIKTNNTLLKSIIIGINSTKRLNLDIKG